jgi:hypothetical protein
MDPAMSKLVRPVAVFGEAVQVGELDGVGVMGDEAQGAAGFDGGELGGVAEEPDEGASFAGIGGDPVQEAGAGHAGFVDRDEVTGVKDEPVVAGPTLDAGVCVVEHVQILGSTTKLRAEDLGGNCRRSERHGPPSGSSDLTLPWVVERA